VLNCATNSAIQAMSLKIRIESALPKSSLLLVVCMRLGYYSATEKHIGGVRT